MVVGGGRLGLRLLFVCGEGVGWWGMEGRWGFRVWCCGFGFWGCWGGCGVWGEGVMGGVGGGGWVGGGGREVGFLCCLGLEEGGGGVGWKPSPPRWYTAQ